MIARHVEGGGHPEPRRRGRISPLQCARSLPWAAWTAVLRSLSVQQRIAFTGRQQPCRGLTRTLVVLLLGLLFLSTAPAAPAADPSLGEKFRKFLASPTPTPSHRRTKRQKSSPTPSPSPSPKAKGKSQAKSSPRPTPEDEETPKPKRKKTTPTPTPAAEDEATPGPKRKKTSPTPAAEDEETPKPKRKKTSPTPTPSPSPSPTETPTPTPEESPSPTASPSPTPESRVATVSPDEIEGYDKNPEPVRKLLETALALTKRNLEYFYGSADPDAGGMDCSGFTYYVLRENGLKEVPRDASGQYVWVRKAGNFRAVLSEEADSFELDELQPGDLLFWTGTYSVERDPPVTHTMIYLGKEKDSGKPIMVGASDGRTYDGEKQHGVSVFDFKTARSKSANTSGTHPRFVGYGKIPGMGDVKP